MKPSLNFDFSEVKFDDEQIPNYTIEFMNQMRNQMYNVRKFGEIQKNQITKWNPQRPMSAQTKYLLTPQEKHRYLKYKESIQHSSNNQSPTLNTSKMIKFGKTNISETIPLINSNLFNSSSDVQLTKQPNSSKVCKKQTQKQMIINKPQQINQMTIDQTVKNEVFGLFDWEDEVDDQFYIKEAAQYLLKNKRLQTIEKVNREQFLQKVKIKNTPKIKNKKLTKEEILKQQEIDILKKQAKLEQLRQNQLFYQDQIKTQNLKQKVDDYDNDFEDEEEQIIKQPIIQQQLISNSEDDNDYGKNDEFEVYEENKVIEIQDDKIQLEQQKSKDFIQNKTTTDSKSNLNLKNPKKFVYRAKNAKERKQELEEMRQELEKNLIDNDAQSANLYNLLKDSREKERIMIEVNTKRREDLALARLTLQQLSEKIDQQLHIIDDLDKKEHYAQQIIEKLKENKKKQQQQYDNEIEKYLACKVIARQLKCKKERKMFLELKRQKFMNMLKQ
ncbi:unnamed protein product [Paramecium pentaurelia]|uniref:Uncharacterized protein n=1 Tax=Paramecium pentaurelia TaxID=43138 RepID=A0A8S1WYZ7_9CILI|nr:unnamed protein product [Paramecium pentaurelia]